MSFILLSIFLIFMTLLIFNKVSYKTYQICYFSSAFLSAINLINSIDLLNISLCLVPLVILTTYFLYNFLNSGDKYSFLIERIASVQFWFFSVCMITGIVFIHRFILSDNL
jgi:hypothetical protein